jgi:hypothetical protein
MEPNMPLVQNLWMGGIRAFGKGANFNAKIRKLDQKSPVSKGNLVR